MSAPDFTIKSDYRGDTGVPAAPSGHSPKGGAATASPAKPSVPNADALVNLMSAWSSLPSHKFHAAYPFFEADRQRTIAEYDLMADDRAKLEATALLFAEYADDIYASGMEAGRAAAENTDAVHDSPVPKADAQGPSA